ncbi:hypothetical protein HZS55_12935 [Halosimplex rubrum]|uniref:Uncharacterized protein n=1 Tax=Halosimplex rubrum TaxID=869889 RepID=A0A7D5T687_9EURY|nr:hypothetical protein [Halosimplex rubrum]QLH78153.1 hypothetical protein HZS55_12935 [Halosimplex rubrum]
MKRRIKILGSAVVVGIGFVVKQALEPDKKHIVEQKLNGKFELHSVEPSKLESLEVVSIDNLDLFYDCGYEVYEYDPETNLVYVIPEELASAGDDR